MLQSSQQPADVQEQMRTVLSAALFTVKTELDALPRCEGPQVVQGVKGEGEKALALLEQYAELLLQSVEKRLDAKT